MSKRLYCGTCNNPTPEDVERFRTLVTNPAVRYVVFGFEVAPGTGTPHLQWGVYFKHVVSQAKVVRLLPRCHVIAANGRCHEVFAYCKKDGSFEEYGEAPLSDEQRQKKGGEGTKALYSAAYELAKQNKIAEIDPLIQIRHFQSLKAISRDHAVQPPDLPGTCGYWYYGDSGAGKSHAARAEFPGFYLKMCNKWWDSYQGQESVIIDDLDIKHEVMAHHLKLWADKYSFPAESKNHSMIIRPKNVIVTSNYHPREIFKDAGSLEPILRRFKVTRFVTFAKWCSDMGEDVRCPLKDVGII